MQEKKERFEFESVGEGLFIAVAREDILDSNAAVVVLDDGVLVVDTHGRPSSAQALIEQIQTVTDKTVRYVINTHFHWDHYQGNSAYVTSDFREVEIISSTSTYESILLRGIPRIRHEIATLPEQLATLSDELDRTKKPEICSRLREELRLKRRYLEELSSLEAIPPSVTFQRGLTLSDKARTVHLLWLGRAHTEGDIVVHLPEDGVVITGDLLHAYMPWMADSYPYDWIRTLERLEDLDFQCALPGHGKTIVGKEQCRLWRDYLDDLMTVTTEVFAEGQSLGQARQEVADRLRPGYGNRFPAGRYSFDQFIEGNIERAYRTVAGWLG
jgi:glyoxylase-like metal-dependent hydrolase (beta-lactamase superfamily II)